MTIQYRASWSVPNAGPSVSTFHFLGDEIPDPAALALAVRTWFADLAGMLPNDVSISFASEFTLHNVATGQLTGSVAVTPPAPVAGNQSGAWAAGAGIRIDWLTAYVRNGRRVRGRTFLVPGASSVYGTDGRVLPAIISQANFVSDTFINACLAAGSPLTVWARPTDSLPGASFPVADASTAGLTATLRGRKY